MSTPRQSYSDSFDADPSGLRFAEASGVGGHFDDALDELSRASECFLRGSSLGCDIDELDRLFAEEGDVAFLAEDPSRVANQEAPGSMSELEDGKRLLRQIKQVAEPQWSRDCIRSDAPTCISDPVPAAPTAVIRESTNFVLGTVEARIDLRARPLPQKSHSRPIRCAKKPTKQVRRKSANSAKQAKRSAEQFRRRSANDVDEITRGNGNPRRMEQLRMTDGRNAMAVDSMFQYHQALVKLNRSMRCTELSRRNLVLQRALLAQQQLRQPAFLPLLMTGGRASRMAAFFSGSRGTLTDGLEHSRRQLAMYFGRVCGQM